VGGPAASAAKNAKNSDCSGLNAINQNVGRSWDDQLSRFIYAAAPAHGRHSSKQSRCLVNSRFDEKRILFAVLRYVSGNLRQIAHGGFSPEQPHAGFFISLAF
jgi:hypothetical protein